MLARRLLLPTLILFYTPSLLHAQWFAHHSPAPPEPALVSTDSANRLHDLLGEMFFSARNNDRDALRAQIAALEIPHYQNWFIRTFGPDRGQTWANGYAGSLEQRETELADLFTRLAHQQGDFSVRKLDATQHDPRTPRLDEYLASWTPSDSGISHDVEPIGYFYLIEGKFRLDSSLPFPHFGMQSNANTVAIRPLLLVSPEYPAEARAQSIGGTVVLNVVLRKDGSVTVVNLAEGNPVLYSAAANAVRRWRCRPYLVNGEPVQVRTKVDVTFKMEH